MRDGPMGRTVWTNARLMFQGGGGGGALLKLTDAFFRVFRITMVPPKV